MWDVYQRESPGPSAWRVVCFNPRGGVVLAERICRTEEEARQWAADWRRRYYGARVRVAAVAWVEME